MRFSCFSKFSAGLRFSSKPSNGETIYKQMVTAEGGALDGASDAHEGARLFATAMSLARARYAKERAANQMFPSTCVELLPVKEREFGLVPKSTYSIAQRQQALAVKMLLAQGNSYAAVTASLTAALGTDFLYYRITKSAERLTSPASPGTGPGNWVHVGYPAKVVLLTSNVTHTVSPVTVSYTKANPLETVVLQAGESIVVSADNIGLAERVVITSATSTTFTTTFANSHDSGGVCTTGEFPYWISTQRHAMIVVSPSAALNSDKRRLVNNVMRDVADGVGTWDIVPATVPGTVDVFTTDSPVLGRTGYAPTGPARTYP